MSKIKKKDLHLKEDAFVSLLDRSRLFIEENKKWFIRGAVAVVLIILIIVGLTNYSRYKHNKAQSMEKIAINLFFKDYLDIENEIAEKFSSEDSRNEMPDEYNELVKSKEEKMSEALKQYRDIYEKYPATNSGERSLYMIGYISYKQDEIDSSFDYLNKYLEKYGENGTFFIPCIKNIASLYEIKGENQKAIDFLENYLSKKDFVFNYPAESLLLQTGLLYMSIEDFLSAQEKFDLLINEYPDSMLKSEAEKYKTFALLQAGEVSSAVQDDEEEKTIDEMPEKMDTSSDEAEQAGTDDVTVDDTAADETAEEQKSESEVALTETAE